MNLAEVLPAHLAGRHLLVVPPGTDVRALAAAWFPAADWDRRPADPAEQPPVVRLRGARFRGIVAEAPTPTTGVLRLDPTTTLDGPLRVEDATSRALGLGVRTLDAWELRVATTADRTVTAPIGAVAAADLATGGLPAVGTGATAAVVPAHGPRGHAAAADQTPAAHVPVPGRDDLALGWTVAAARRVGGAVLPADGSRVVAPDPSSAVGLTLWSPVPLPPQDVVPLLRPALAGARVGPTELPQPTQADPGAQPFSLAATFEYDGVVTVQASRAQEVPLVLSTVDQRQYGTWAYRVEWQPPGDVEGPDDQPSQLHLIARSRVLPSVARVAATLWRVAGGTVVDSGGFVVTPEELAERSRTDLR